VGGLPRVDALCTVGFTGPGGVDDDWSAQAYSPHPNRDAAWFVPTWVVHEPGSVPPSLQALAYIELLARRGYINDTTLETWRQAYAPECAPATSDATSEAAQGAIAAALAHLDAAAVPTPPCPEWPRNRGSYREQAAAVASRAQALFPPRKGATRPGTYHLRVDDVLSALARTRPAALPAVLRTARARVGQPNQFVAAYLLWRHAVPGVDRFLRRTRADHVPYEAWPKAWKPLSTAIKRHGSPLGHPGSAPLLAEAETLVGYGFGGVDWEQERKNRADLALATNFGQGEIIESLRHLYGRALAGARPQPMSLDEFWARRWWWIASGSEAGAAGALPRDAFAPAFSALGGRRVHHTHRSAAEARGAGFLGSLIHTAPHITATASAKVNERGKVRALYAGDPASYYVTAAALAPAEAAWEDEEAVLAPGAADELHEVAELRSALTGGMGMMYDFDDFNIMHRHEHLAATFTQLTRALPGAGPDHAAACAWVAAACADQKIVWPDGRVSVATNGLFSGWRATTWSNTVLNWAYFDCAVKRAKAEAPVELLRRRHVGDDVYSVADSWLAAVNVYDALQAAGARAQPSKVLFSAEAAEFLRVRYDGRGVHGYVARTLCGLAGGDPAASEAVTPLTRIPAIAETLSRCTARGLDSAVAGALFRRLAAHWGAAVAYPGAPPVPPPAAAIHAARPHGGCGVYWDGADARKWAYTRLPSPPTSAPAIVNPRVAPTLATDEALSRVAAALPPSWQPALRRLRQAFADASYAKPYGAAVHEVGRARAAAELSEWYEAVSRIAPARAPHCAPDTVWRGDAARAPPDVAAVQGAVARALSHDKPARPRLHGAIPRIPGAAVALRDPVWRTHAGVRALLSVVKPRLLPDFDALAAAAGTDSAVATSWGADGAAYGAIVGVSPMLRDYASLVNSTLRASRSLVATPLFSGTEVPSHLAFAEGLRFTAASPLPRIGYVRA